MRVLMLSTDQNILREGTETRQRMIEYGSLVEELHIIVYTDAKNTNKMRMMRISENIFVYPTSTRFKPFYFWDAYKIGKQIIRNWKLEIRNSRDKVLVTSQDPFETGLVGHLLKRKFKLPLQIQVHTDFLSPYFWRESLKNKIRVLLGKWLVKKVLRQGSGQADCLRVVSERIKNSLESSLRADLAGSRERSVAGSNLEIAASSATKVGTPRNDRGTPKITVLPIFVDVEAIKAAPIKIDLHKKYPGYDFIILMASRLTKEKNIGMAIEAFADAKKANPTRMMRTLLLIVGDGPELKSYKLLVKSYKLENNVKFEFAIDPQTLFSYYKTADLFLNTSNYEGYGRTIVEALVAGCPIISTDVGIAREFIKEDKSGIIIEPNNRQELVEALTEVIANRGQYQGFIETDIINDKAEYLKLYKKNWEIC